VHIAYYVTAHGYGHGVRTCAIANNFSIDLNLTLISGLPEQFFREEIHRPFRYRKAEFDCGCLQVDAMNTDIEKTLQEYMRIDRNNCQIIDKEVKWVKKEGIDGIAGDVPPFAFEVAAAAGIPSVAVTNFTWHDIYSGYLQSFPSFKPCLDHIENQYASAGLLCALEPALPMTCFSNRKEIPVTGRNGRNVRDALIEKYHLRNGMKIGLIYVGNLGLKTVEWKKLEKHDGWEFLGINPLPCNPVNFHLVEKNDFRYQDLMASVDLAIGKIGYSSFAESFLSDTPILFLPRHEFAEYAYLEKAALAWGGGHVISMKDFYSLNWEKALSSVTKRNINNLQKVNGASLCSSEIETFIRNA
jgi:hypothetical protein